MPEVIKKYQTITNKGLIEVEELDNGIMMETIIEPSNDFLQTLSVLPPPPLPQPNQDDYLLDLDYRICMIELGL